MTVGCNRAVSNTTHSMVDNTQAAVRPMSSEGKISSVGKMSSVARKLQWALAIRVSTISREFREK